MICELLRVATRQFRYQSGHPGVANDPVATTYADLAAERLATSAVAWRG